MVSKDIERDSEKQHYPNVQLRIIERDRTEDELFSSVSVQKFFDERFSDKEAVEKAVIMHKYVWEKYQINSFGVYIYCLEYIIKNGSVKELTNNIDRIVSGKRRDMNKETNINMILLNSVEKMLKEMTEPEIELLEKPKERVDDKPLLVRVYEAYNMLKYPEYTKMMGSKEKHLLEKKTFRTIKEALG